MTARNADYEWVVEAVSGDIARWLRVHVDAQWSSEMEPVRLLAHRVVRFAQGRPIGRSEP